ncbi:MAG: NAAT family transporter [Betaproteobacteria bacterium]|nr:NAAT family transporter [Betaproteobacteria bacterium]
MSVDPVDVLQGVLIVVGALLPIVNPLGNAPFFLALTQGATDAERGALARKVALNCLVLLLAALFFGDNVLAFFGVSVPVVQLAGGLVVAALGWQLLGEAADQADTAPAPSAAASEARAFYPLTLPLTVGPGSISVAITIGANFPSTIQPYLADAAAAVIGALVVCIATYACYRYAEAIARLLGAGGTAVVLRLSAFIMLCIGVQVMVNGGDALFHFLPEATPGR